MANAKREKLIPRFSIPNRREGRDDNDREQKDERPERSIWQLQRAEQNRVEIELDDVHEERGKADLTQWPEESRRRASACRFQNCRDQQHTCSPEEGQIDRSRRKLLIRREQAHDARQRLRKQRCRG